MFSASRAKLAFESLHKRKEGSGNRIVSTDGERSPLVPRFERTTKHLFYVVPSKRGTSGDGSRRGYERGKLKWGMAMGGNRLSLGFCTTGKHGYPPSCIKLERK
jgi:hypothetical protein